MANAAAHDATPSRKQQLLETADNSEGVHQYRNLKTFLVPSTTGRQ
jgi:hypothetical protein